MPALRILVILASAALAGCVCCGTSPEDTDVSLTDRRAFIPSARASLDIARARARVDNPSVPHNGHGVELTLSGTSGENTQNLSAGDLPVGIGGRAFSAPATLRHEYDLIFAEAAYRFRRFFGSRQAFGIEALAGVVSAQLDVTTSSATERAVEKTYGWGPVWSFGIVWKFLPTTSLQSRLGVLFASDEKTGFDAQRLELHVAQALGRHAALRAGYSSWRIAVDRTGPFESEISARFSGFALGLDVMF